MLKALTFLGIGPPDGYQSTTYVKHDGSTTYETYLFPEAVAKLYEPEQITVFVTPLVQQDAKGYLKYLNERLDSQLQIENIPNGNSEAELWEIFQICADAVDEGDEIIFDITHAFRSLPLLIFIVAVYLRQVKNITLTHIIYGGYEARDRHANRSPIFDLTPFIRLLDWTNAVNVFQRSGDARPIAGLDVPEDISNALSGLSEALLTNRTLEAQNAAFAFNRLNLGQNLQSPAPFGMLIGQLQANYRDMAVYIPNTKPQTNLKKQFVQIRWYVENQHYLQAITLIREWLVSWECLQQNHGDWLSQHSRKAAEKALNERLEHQDSQFSKALEVLITDQTSTKLWEQCSVLRNDLAHCGMRHNPKPQSATDAIQAIKTLFQEFEQFVQQNLD